MPSVAESACLLWACPIATARAACLACHVPPCVRPRCWVPQFHCNNNKTTVQRYNSTTANSMSQQPMLQCEHHSAGALIASCNDPAMILQHCQKKKKSLKTCFLKTLHTHASVLSYLFLLAVLDDCLCYCLPLLHSHQAVYSDLVLICVQTSSVPWFLTD